MASIQYGSKTKRSSFHTKWIFPLFFKPARTMGEIVEQETRNWLTPLLILSVLVLIVVLIGAPIQRQAIQMGTNLPPDFQYYSPEQQNQYYQAQANQTSPLFLYVFPTLSGLLKVWLPWFLLSIILYLALTLSGSRANSTRFYNLVGWSMLPLALRYLVEIAVMLITKSQISAPGLAGFIDSAETGANAYFRSLLGFIDIYFVFQVVLLLIGTVKLSGITRTKTAIATLISVVILLLLEAIPGWLSSALSGINLSSGFFF